MTNYIAPLIVFILMLTLSQSIISQSDTTSYSYSLHIEIKNIKSAEGTMMIAMYNNPLTFLKEDVYKGISQKVTGEGIMEVEIPGIPAGSYAISIYHDKNDNGKLDTKIFKLPKEPYGFSNNAKGKMGPPPFDKAKFEITTATQSIEITLK